MNISLSVVIQASNLPYGYIYKFHGSTAQKMMDISQSVVVPSSILSYGYIYKFVCYSQNVSYYHSQLKFGFNFLFYLMVT